MIIEVHVRVEFDAAAEKVASYEEAFYLATNLAIGELCDENAENNPQVNFNIIEDDSGLEG